MTFDESAFLKSIVDGLKPEFDRVRDDGRAQSSRLDDKLSGKIEETREDIKSLRKRFEDESEIIVAWIAESVSFQRETNNKIDETNKRLDRMISLMDRFLKVATHG